MAMYTNHIVQYCMSYNLGEDEFEDEVEDRMEKFYIIKERNPAKLTRIPDRVLWLRFFDVSTSRKLRLGKISNEEVYDYRRDNYSGFIYIGQKFDKTETRQGRNILKYLPDFRGIVVDLRAKKYVGVVKHLYYDYAQDYEYNGIFSIDLLTKDDEVILHTGQLRSLDKIM